MSSRTTLWLNERRDASAITIYCGRCPNWTFVGTFAESREAVRLHRRSWAHRRRA